MIAVANAPCSYGAFEITVGIDPNVPDSLPLLDDVARAGYAGIDLGPVGYLGTGDELRARLQERSLALAGGYFAVPFSDPEALDGELTRLDELLDTFDAARDGSAGTADTLPLPRPTVADAGSDARSAYPGRAVNDRSLGWDDAGWDRFAQALARIVARCRERGYEPTFHPHTATYVEAPWEIDRLLECSDVGVCLDTGHLLLGGGDPVTAVGAWGARINHLHVKDARLEIITAIIAESAPVEEIWRRRAFCRLGEGDVPIDRVLDGLREIGYSGWLVVEQDIIPDPADPPDQAAQDQAANREFLAARGI
ncbi:MAG TPA: sugar phosphate isomerase/epimerase [Solirubrobacteraceae bacterium]|nr:sugar phosphate isomerase/epimerase [Solirubrobacteraceae bacterium]